MSSHYGIKIAKEMPAPIPKPTADENEINEWQMKAS
jgi:hypothetical protein